MPTSGSPTPRPGRTYYGGPHAGTWTYGLPELPGQRELIAASTRVANTGCYAAAITLALAPLIAAGVVCPEDVVVVASSGTTGAGRGLKASLLASEVMGGLSAYKVGAHQHVPGDQAGERRAPRCPSPRCWPRCPAASSPRSPPAPRAR